MSAKSLILRLLLVVVVAAAGGALWVAHRIRPQTLEVRLTPCLPVISLESGRWVVRTRADALLGEVADFHSELLAYLYFEYLKSHAGLASSQLLLTAQMTESGPSYRISLVLDRDILAAVAYLAHLRAEGYISHFQIVPVPHQDLAYRRLQTVVFLDAYNPLAVPRLDSVASERLLQPLARFLVFKSETDRRVRKQIFPVPLVLSESQAQELAKDILAVTTFYKLPLDVFLGIGAMENNYMNVRGDLDHAVWKRRPQRGDIILERHRGRVLVSDYAMGVWQITRETLRYAHSLYLKDKRDYTLLPPRLRPAKELNFDLDNSEVLTTYAGLLLRHLLDKSNGNVQVAVGAYNGSLRSPNLQYSAGVKLVALYARSFLERASTLDGMNVAQKWLIRGPSPTTKEDFANVRSTVLPSNLSMRPEPKLPSQE